MRGNAPGTAYEVGNEKLLKNLWERGYKPTDFLGETHRKIRRTESIDKLRSELSAWEVERNEIQACVNWQFRTKDARIKLSSLYPEL